MIEKSAALKIWDFIGLPFRLLLFDQAWLPRWKWTTLEEERVAAAWPYLSGRVLDIGAGSNSLVRQYGNGVGIDVVDWGAGAIVVQNSAMLPFADDSFDTVTILAALNHIPERAAALVEAARLLRPDGRLLITMINPLLGDIGHALWWYSEDKKRGGMKPGEVGGMWTTTVVELAAAAGFRLAHHRRFLYGMNNLYIFERQ